MGNMFKCALKQGGSGGSGADLIVTCSAEFAGATITASKTGSTSQTQTCPSTSPYVVTFSGLDNGTWTVSGTISGQTYSVQATITDFSAILEFGFNWQEWLDSAQYLDSSDYNDLDEVLEDEEALRELFLEHNCVDYLADVSTASANVTKILNTDLAAKWINDSDYALDTLSANAEIKAVMDEADKYGYGEWVIVDNTTTPPTWGAKGCVPVMTSNTAPYGTASTSLSVSGYDAYKAFDNMSYLTSGAKMGGSADGNWIQYEFTNPICVKCFEYAGIGLHTANDHYLGFTAKIEVSNDNSTWTEIGEHTWTKEEHQATFRSPQKYQIANADNVYAKYVRFRTTSNNYDYNYENNVGKLQFYGRQLTVSVPVMTSDTAPFGELASGSEATNYEAYKTFDNNASTYWLPVAGSTEDKWYLQYKFNTKMCARMVAFQMPSSYLRIKEFEVQGSNDGTTWETVFTQAITPSVNLFVFNFANVDGYDYCRFRITDQTDRPSLIMLQFYGLDYSEKEFEAGTTKKWLYDHGVELEAFNTNASVTKGDNELTLTTNGSQADVSIDLTNYNLARCKVGSHMSGTSTIFVGTLASSNLTTANAPNNESLDVSAINQTLQIGVKMTASGTCDITELWLE